MLDPSAYRARIRVECSNLQPCARLPESVGVLGSSAYLARILVITGAVRWGEVGQGSARQGSARLGKARSGKELTTADR